MFEIYLLRVLLAPRFKVRRPFRECLPFWERFRLARLLARRVFLAPPQTTQPLDAGLFEVLLLVVAGLSVATAGLPRF